MAHPLPMPGIPAPWVRQATKGTDEYLRLTDTCVALGSTRGGGANSSGFNVTAPEVAAFNAARFQLRPACRGQTLATLDYLFDGVFWADMVATFATGVPFERSIDVKCVSALTPASAAH
jgi:hypothetical protein